MAQIAAVIGRGFSYPLVRAVAKMEDQALQTALERLAEADILLVQGFPPESEYRFKHALIRMRLMRTCLRAVARLCTAARVRFCAISLPPPLQPSRSCSRITSRRQG